MSSASTAQARNVMAAGRYNRRPSFQRLYSSRARLEATSLCLKRSDTFFYLLH